MAKPRPPMSTHQVDETAAERPAGLRGLRPALQVAGHRWSWCKKAPCQQEGPASPDGASRRRPYKRPGKTKTPRVDRGDAGNSM